MKRAAHVAASRRATWYKKQRDIKYLSRYQRREFVRYVYPAEDERRCRIATVPLRVAMRSRPSKPGRWGSEGVTTGSFSRCTGVNQHPSPCRGRTHLERRLSSGSVNRAGHILKEVVTDRQRRGGRTGLRHSRRGCARSAHDCVFNSAALRAGQIHQVKKVISKIGCIE